MGCVGALDAPPADVIPKEADGRFTGSRDGMAVTGAVAQPGVVFGLPSSPSDGVVVVTLGGLDCLLICVVLSNHGLGLGPTVFVAGFVLDNRFIRVGGVNRTIVVLVHRTRDGLNLIFIFSNHDCLLFKRLIK